jgi:uncharacterized protein (TIGR00251 family)
MLRIHVRIIPNAGKNSIVQEEGRLKIKVTAPAIDGKANKALIELLADHFKVRKSAINIIKGDKGRDKIIEINTE